jgi:NAD+ synthase (glutamine-hydrolysing)
VLTKVPSAELKPDQRDDQSLPPYEILDPILQAYVEGDHTVNEILAMDLADAEVVQRVCRLVDIAEYKRRQTPVGARLTSKAFGRDRRMPIINRYRG